MDTEKVYYLLVCNALYEKNIIANVITDSEEIVFVSSQKLAHN